MQNLKISTSDSLIFKTSKRTGKERIDVTIKLNEECKNGYEYFSMTCSGYEIHRGRWIDTFGGCAHDEILKVFPEFEIFKTVHLWSFGGFSTHAVANGFYFIKNGFDSCGIDSPNFAQYYSNYFNCTIEQFNILKDSENKFEFSVLLVELGVVDGWKKTISKAVKKLEELTGLNFKSKYEKDKNDISMDSDKLKEFRQKQKDGFYKLEAKQERENKRLSDLKEAMIKKVNDEYKKQVSKYEKEKNICLELIRQGFEICTRTGNIKGAIYYNHSNELNFNWSTEKVKESDILYFIENINKEQFSGLKITNDKKETTTI